MTAPAAVTALQVADWRRRTHALYAEVRRVAVDDPAAAHRVWCAGRDRLFGTHPASPITDRTGFTGLPVAAYDPDWRFIAVIEPAPDQLIMVGTGTDGDVPFRRIGQVALGQIGIVDVWWHEGYAGGLFVPVRDGSSGHTSYGGGRYLLDTAKGADLGTVGSDETLVLDLNFAYHPSCAYDPAWACPLPQAGNTVDAVIEVGERLR